MENPMEDRRIDIFLHAVSPPEIFPLPEKEVPLCELLGGAAESTLVVDGEGCIVWVNRKSEELFEYGRGELLGQFVEILVPERHREAHRRHRAGYARDPRDRPMGSGFDLVARRRDGSEFPAEISLSHFGEGRDLLVMALIRDISEQKRIEKLKMELTRERIERLEEELHILERLTAPRTMDVTARHFGILPLKEYATHIFAELVEEYRGLMDQALEARVFKTAEPPSEKLRAMAARLGFLKADARDVVDIHSAALRKKSLETAAPKVRGYVEEGHLLLVELMGYLASCYRNLAHPVDGKGPGNPPA
jgi:two-component system sensor kinase FixL